MPDQDYNPDTNLPVDVGPGEAAPPEDFDTVLRQRDEYRDLALRKAAEFDNYRKRVERERRELSELAATDLIKQILPLLDDLERALQTESSDAATYRQGVELIHRQLLDLLAKRGVEVMDPLGADFDPHAHEAIAREPAGNHRDGEIVEVYNRGYRLGDRLLRPAKVKVATA